MYVSKPQAALNRGALLQAASRLFRARGFDGVGVAEIAKQAGLTHGALYKHFPSKDALAAAAFSHAAAARLDRGRHRKQTFEERLDAMFSAEHRDNLENGCPMTASASEIARQGTAVGASFTRVFQEAMADIESLMDGGISAAEKRRLAITALAAQIGAVAVARAVVQIEPSLSEEVLQTVRETVGSALVHRQAVRSKPEGG